MKLFFRIPQQGRQPRLEYVIQLAGNILGYPWEIIAETEPVIESGLVISYRADPAGLPDSGLPAINIYNSGQLCDLDKVGEESARFDHGEYSVPLLGKMMQFEDNSGWQHDEKYRYYSRPGVSGWLIAFDWYLNIFYHISRFEEQGRHSLRESEKDSAASILSRHEGLQIPVVDVLLDYLDKLIRLKIAAEKRTALRVMNWPGGEMNGVALTHDVDLTRGLSYKKRAWKTGIALLRKMIGDRNALLKNRMEIDRLDARVWSFPQLLDFYDRKKWKATFFFLAKRFENIHYRYNIESAKFQALFDELKHHNHEIGLHSSLHAFSHRKKFATEKHRMEKATGIKCAGLRQHYLRALFPGLWRIAEAAHFAYDSSLAYNFEPGFRAGTTHPFFTYDWEQDRNLSLLEFPLAFFDYNILRAPDGLPSARQRMNQIVGQVAHFHGLLVFLLHPGNFMEPAYRELWDALINELDRRRIYTDTLSGHYKWFKFKEHIEIIPELQDKTRKIWTVKKPPGLRTFSLEVIGTGSLNLPIDISFEKIGEQCYTINTDKTKMEVVLDSF